MPTMTSTIYLCSNVPLSSRYDHTIYFSNESEQRSYFLGKVAHRVNDVSYLRKSWSIKIVSDMDSARKWSYLFFRNNDAGKYWYYFVTDVQYVNDNTVELSLELDVMQTYMFDWVLNSCFIEREHTFTDNFGDHTVDEGLDTGELIVVSNNPHSWNDCCILLLSTVVLGVTGNPKIYASRYNNVFVGAAVYAVKASDWEALGVYLDGLSADGKIDAIMSIWMYPRELVTLASGSSWNSGTIFKEVQGCDLINVQLPAVNSVGLDGLYQPKNKKLLQYPFNFLYVTNNNGGAAIYKYEYFGDETDPRANLFGTLSAEGVAYMYPLHYKGVDHNYEEGLQISGFPTCAWNADVYKLWLAQNQNQQQLAGTNAALTIAGGAIATVAGLATGNMIAAAGGAGTMLHGVNSIQSLLVQRKDMEIQPPQARGNHSSSLPFTAGEVGYRFQRKTVDNAHAKVIDDFFTMFGYASHRVGKPRLSVRPYWTYVKTRDSNVTGNIPNADLRKINEIFDAGVTFWVGGEHVYDYSLDNSPAAG